MHRSLRLLFLALGMSVWGAINVIGCVADSPEAINANDASANDGTTKPQAQSCTNATECATGFCVDGLCCDAACNGSCEACNVAGSEGKCSPIPDGEDPANECGATPPRPDAGLPDGGDAGDAGDAGPKLSFPDGGVTYADTTCAKKCNGKRACAFPGKEKTCGSVFCGDLSTQGRMACNGEGYCDLALEKCNAYACPDGNPGCKTTCDSPNDCASTHYCEGTSKKCVPKRANGVTADQGVQCLSGYVKDGVCCDDACDIPGGTCAQAGHAGECRCNKCTTGATPGRCRLWYRDIDADGYGDVNGRIADDTAVAGCLDVQPQAGFVANKDDCYDFNSPQGTQVHPGQTGWFNVPFGPDNSYDYNCDRGVQKQYRATSSYSCKTCAFSCGSSCAQGDTTAPICDSTILVLQAMSTPMAICPACPYYGRCSLDTSAAIYSSTGDAACGNTTWTAFTCGSCTASGPPSPYGFSVKQGCH